MEAFEYQFYTPDRKTVQIKIGPTPSGLYEHLELFRYERILRAVLAALARAVNTDNIEAWWEPVWRLVGEWLGFYAHTEVVGQKRIWINQYRVTPFMPDQTVAAPATTHTKMEVPDLITGFHIMLQVGGNSYTWFHTFGFEELKRALSRKASESLDGIPLTGPAMGRLMAKLEEAAAQGERQAALHFKELHRRLKRDPAVLAALPKRYYVMATAGPWFAIGAGQDAPPPQLLDAVIRLPTNNEVVDDVEDEVVVLEPAHLLQAPNWAPDMRQFGFTSRLGLTWLPHIYHINSVEGWKQLGDIRAWIKEEIDAKNLPGNGWILTIAPLP
ncbi:hypothetical protein DFH06DRAFT_1234271 [Mycena polygramma]|nr:hypothetical protein DFH06DRAFT_1234271 [Mycena polygramma]